MFTINSILSAKCKKRKVVNMQSGWGNKNPKFNCTTNLNIKLGLKKVLA